MRTLSLFEPLDLPPDIHILINNSSDTYVFQKGDLFFIIGQEEEEGSTFIFFVCDNNGKTNGDRVFEDIYPNKTQNINDLLWKISDYPYNRRFLRLEMIERMRHIKNEQDLDDIISFLKKYNINQNGNITDSD